MIQIQQAKDDLAGKGLLFFLRIRAASVPLACAEGTSVPFQPCESKKAQAISH